MEFIHILQALMSTNNQLRKDAETHFQTQLEQNPQEILLILLQNFSNQNLDPVIRLFSAVLLRRATENYVSKLNESNLEQFRQLLFQCWIQEPDSKLSLKLSHVIAQTTTNSPWNNLIPSLFQVVQTNNNLSLNTLALLELLADYSPELVTLHYQKISEFLAAFLSSDNPLIRMTCAKATVACIAGMDNDNARNHFTSFIDPILNVLGSALSLGDESDATNLIEHLVSVAQLQPLFFKQNFDNLVNCMFTVGNSESLEISTRLMSLELLITLVESAPALARRSNGFAENLIKMTMTFMLEVDDDEESWKRGSYLETDEDEDALTGDEAIERISSGLGGKSVSDIILTLVQGYFNNSDWRYRRAAVASVCRLAEGSTKHFSKYLNHGLTFLNMALQDHSVRVQYEAIQTVGRFSELFSENSSQLVELFLPVLATLMQNPNNCPKIRGHCASALINLLHPKTCDKEALEKFLEPLLQSLLSCLQDAPYEVRAPCLVVLGCVSQISQESFAPYYDRFMPGIKSILIEATSSEFVELRGKAMECAGLIGEAVGDQKFAKDALEIMRIFVHAMNLDVERDITFEYILPACARISKAIGTDFIEFLPIVFDPLIQGAKQHIEFSMVDADDDDVEGEVVHDDETGTESTVVSLGAGVKKRVTLNTHAVQQKTQAAKILYEFASSLGFNLGQYLLLSIEALIPMIGDRHSNDIRASSALSLHKMYDALLTGIQLGKFCLNTQLVDKAIPVDLQLLFQTSIMKVLDALKIEPDSSARQTLTETLRDILLSTYEAAPKADDGSRPPTFPIELTEEITFQIVSGVLLQSAECLLRRNDKEESYQNDKYDHEDQDDDEITEEDDLLTVLVDVIGYLLKILREKFLNIFEKAIAPSFAVYLQPDQPTSLKVIACCLMDDLIEFGGPATAVYYPQVIPLLFVHSQSDDNLLRQCSMYGLAIATNKNPAAMINFIGPLLSCFVSTILRTDAKEEDCLGITENAVFGLGQLLMKAEYRQSIKANAAQFPLFDTMKLFLSKLPLKLDEIEAKTSILQVCSLLQNQDEILFQHENSLFNELLRVFSEVYQISQQKIQKNTTQNHLSNLSDPLNNDEDDDTEIATSNTLLMLDVLLQQFKTLPQILKAYHDSSYEVKQILSSKFQ